MGALFAATFLAIEWAKKATDEARFLVWRKWLYLLFSPAFYGLASGKLLVVMLASIGTNHALTHWMHRSRSRLAVALAVTFNVVLLGTFKYAYFVAGLSQKPCLHKAFNGASFDWSNGCCHSAFPSTHSNPSATPWTCIEDACPSPPRCCPSPRTSPFFRSSSQAPSCGQQTSLPQLERRVSDSLSSQKHHLGLIVQGFMKKMVFGDWVGTLLVDPVFGAPGNHSGVDLALALYGYSLQVYADFSGTRTWPKAWPA